MAVTGGGEVTVGDTTGEAGIAPGDGVGCRAGTANDGGGGAAVAGEALTVEGDTGALATGCCAGAASFVIGCVVYVVGAGTGAGAGAW